MGTRCAPVRAAPDQGSSTAELACGLFSVIALLGLLLTVAVATNQYRQCHAAADYAARSASRGVTLDEVTQRVQRRVGPAAHVTIAHTDGVVTATVTTSVRWLWWESAHVAPVRASAHYVDETIPGTVGSQPP